MLKNGLIKTKLKTKLMSQPEKQTITMHVLANISRSKDSRVNEIRSVNRI